MKKGLISCLILLLLIIMCGLLCGFNRFLPNSVIKSESFELSVGLQSYHSAVNQVFDKLNNFKYNLITYDNQEYLVDLKDIVEELSDSNISSLIQDKNRSIFAGNLNFSLNELLIFKSEKINEIVLDINEKTKLKGVIDPKNAEIYFDVTDNQFKINKEINGNLLNNEASNLILNMMKNYVEKIDLMELGCYTLPEIISTNTILQTNLQKYLEYSKMVLVYNMQGEKVQIDIQDYNSWLVPNYMDNGSLNNENPFSVNKELVAAFVVTLSDKYDTVGKERSFKTSIGSEVIIKKGNYGWNINNAKITEDIIEHILSQISEEKDLILKQKADIFGESDIGNTYIEVSISEQHLWMYKNGELIVDCPIVTGSVNQGHSTPKGIYKLTYKTRNTVLRGPGYASPVSYWMPFNGGVGLHDATWRSSFGKNIYINNGSHGCVNMPLKSAKIVYENITDTMPIIVW